MKMAIGHIKELRQRCWLEPDDTSMDDEILGKSAMERVSMLFGWHFGDPGWAKTVKKWCESQGIYWTENPNADGVIK
jgi:hypothetical protein